MKCLFVSDAHYPISNKIISFLLDVYLKYDSIFILGDLFEFYYGYKDYFYPHHRELLWTLKVVSSKTRLVIFEGNHEYKLKNLSKKIDVEIVEKYLVENIDGKSVFMAHGDTIDKNDISYRFFRASLKNKVALKIIGSIPPNILLNLSKMASKLSKENLKSKVYHNTAAALEKFAEKKIKSGIDVVILAHTHNPVFKRVKNGLYINTGEFFREFTFVSYESGEFSLKKLTGG